MVYECWLTGYGTYMYWDKKMLDFNETSDVVTAMLQNLIGNIISFNNIYQRILKASKINDTETMWYNIGKIFYIMATFEPIMEETRFNHRAR